MRKETIDKLHAFYFRSVRTSANPIVRQWSAGGFEHMTKEDLHLIATVAFRQIADLLEIINKELEHDYPEIAAALSKDAPQRTQ